MGLAVPYRERNAFDQILFGGSLHFILFVLYKRLFTCDKKCQDSIALHDENARPFVLVHNRPTIPYR
jgi:hypothetical protein